MSSSSSISSIRSPEGRHFIPEKMFTASAPMPGSAKNSYLVDKIAFLHKNF
jgi:hypothetical protein